MSDAIQAHQDHNDPYLGRTLEERYRLDTVIGSGANGKVYAGTQLVVDRKVAIKLLHPSVQDRELGTERFLREAKAVARLSHAGCLTLFDFGLDDELGCFYMVTEFVEGETLADFARRQRMTPGQIYEVLFQITAALEHAHDAGILHRDLKPENIMLMSGAESSGGRFAAIKVLDFGLARIREEAALPRSSAASSGPHEEVKPADAEWTRGVFSSPERLTHFGELNGTPAYMSPEQCRGELGLTPACDYYALGVLAYELFEGELPFQADAIYQLIALHLDSPVPPMRSGRAPAEVEEMIMRLMEKDPARRLQSSADILEILRRNRALDAGGDDATKRGGLQVSPAEESELASAARAETLVGYEQVEAPLLAGEPTLVAEPKDAEEVVQFATTLAAGPTLTAAPAPEKARAAGDIQPEESAKKEGRRSILLLGAPLILLLGALGFFWLKGAPGSADNASEERARSGADERPREPELDEGAAGGAGEAEERDGPEELKAGRESQEASSDERGAELEQEPDDESAEPEGSQDSEERIRPAEPARPKKLKLTY